MAAEMIPGLGGGIDPLLLGALQPTAYLGAVPPSSRPSEYGDAPTRDIVARIDTGRRERGAGEASESLAAGFRPRTPGTRSRAGSGFESGGVLDTSAPSGTLAGLADAVTRDGRLAELADDELIGVLRAWQRLESWSSANLLATVAELARRRPADQATPTAPGEFPGQISEFVSDEVAAALTFTSRVASDRTDLALDLAIRLPATFRAHHAGLIELAKVRLIADATGVLSQDDARTVEAEILARAEKQTTGQLRAALARAVLAVDPAAAARRREEAQRDPRVRRWQEDAGTAALAGYGLPPADVLAADQQLTARALALRDAGLPGSIEELRARAYLDALLDRDSTPAPSQPAPPASGPAVPVFTPAAPVPSPSAPGPSAPSPSSPDPSVPSPSALATDQAAALPAGGEPGAPSPAAPTPGSRPGLRLPALINLTVPLTTGLGLADEPGVVAGFGPIDALLARDLIDAASTDPRTRCCLTVTGPDGQAIGHGCLPGPGASANLGIREMTVTIHPLARGSCGHQHQEPGYQPSRKLRHLITARNPTCTAPGCRRPAGRCDLDHTMPYDQDGPTCECNLAPLCRHHHRCKHSEGWRLEQPSPGTVRWTTPAGRQYTTRPDAGGT